MSDRNYTTPAAKTFVEEAEDAGYEVEHYFGYAFYEGPAVRIDNDAELVDFIRLTTPRIKWDTLGMGYIVYTAQSDKGEDED